MANRFYILPDNCGKRRYPTFKHAQKALDKILRKGHKERTKKPVRAYRCEFCRYYHLTSRPIEKEPQILLDSYSPEWTKYVKPENEENLNA